MKVVLSLFRWARRGQTLAALAFFACSAAHASVVEFHRWRMGEEIGGVPGGYYYSGFTENLNGNPNWVNLWGSGFLGAGAPGSTVSAVNPRLNMAENAVNRLTTWTDNFGVEFWVKFTGNLLSPMQNTIVANGNWSIERQANFLLVRFSDGSWLVDDILANQWLNVALVRQSGVNTVYINGRAYRSNNVLVSSGGSNIHAPSPTGATAVGYRLGVFGQDLMGSLDELRSFDATNFVESDLYFNQTQVPEPATALLALIGLAAVIRLRLANTEPADAPRPMLRELEEAPADDGDADGNCAGVASRESLT